MIHFKWILLTLVLLIVAGLGSQCLVDRHPFGFIMAIIADAILIWGISGFMTNKN